MSLKKYIDGTTTFTIMVLFAIQTRMLKESHHLRQHSFQYIGSGYTQDKGDDLCRQAYGELGGYRTSNNIRWNQRSGGSNGNIIYAHDGAVINGASHILYQQPTGECVADK
jgi:hypothetical protein